MGSNEIFLNAKELRNNARAYLIIHNEVRSLENALLFAADNGLLDVQVRNTYMTNTNLESYSTVSVDHTNNIFTKTNHSYLDGDEIQFVTSGDFPDPISNLYTYYVKVVDVNTFKICSQFLDVINGVTVDIIDNGTGTLQCRRLEPSQKFYKTWKGQSQDRPLNDQMNGVINHFTKLGYSIRRETNPLNQEVFQWVIQW